MELLRELLELVKDYGVSTVIFFGLIVLGYFKRDWLMSTLQAAAIVRQHEETIAELRREIQELREKLEEYNNLLLQQTATIARLEERVIHAAKSRVSSRKPKVD
jgi:hypothetical protein